MTQIFLSVPTEVMKKTNWTKVKVKAVWGRSPPPSKHKYTQNIIINWLLPFMFYGYMIIQPTHNHDCISL